MIFNKPHYVDFEFEKVFHLYTRVSGNENIFRQDRNYLFFLDKINFYLSPYLEIHGYCLVPQRFSLLVTFRSCEEIRKILQISDEVEIPNTHQFLMQPVSNLLNSYSKSYNKMYGRKGALFIDYIKRDKIQGDVNVKNRLRNIHQIPVENLVSDSITNWKYSSYKAYLHLEKPSRLSRENVMKLFEGKDDYVAFHK